MAPHEDRRVLDPMQEAHARRMGDTWIVTAGLSTIIADSQEHAWRIAVAHNEIRDHLAQDRRQS